MKKLKYWFDNVMSRGSAVMLSILTAVMILVVLLIAAVIQLCGFGEEGAFSTIWDVLSTTINAWMPSAEDGSIGYVIMIALSAIVGLFFTSFVIGIISTAVEDKLSALRKGNSDVVEKDHMVVLGLEIGKYTLLRQLILAAGEEKTCIVLAEEMDKEEMEEAVRENVELPKNVRLVCRNLDVTDPVALEKVAPADARFIIVTPTDDRRTTKTMLALTRVLKDADRKARVVTTVEDDTYMLPSSLRRENGLVVLRTDEIMARIIAHSCTHAGLSKAFSEVFKFEGNEFHPECVPNLAGHTWGELVLSARNGVPVGILREGKTLLNPDKELMLSENDAVLAFETEKGSIAVSWENGIGIGEPNEAEMVWTPQKILIIGISDKLDEVLRELPDDVTEVSFIGEAYDEQELIFLCERYEISIDRTFPRETIADPDALEEALAGCGHVIVLSDEDGDEDGDIDNIMALLRLQEIRRERGLSFTVTMELEKEENRSLLPDDGLTDLIVSSDMASMVLTQVAVTPDLYDTFHELLSNEGNEFCLMNPAILANDGETLTVKEIRRRLLHVGGCLLGYLCEGEKEEICLNPDADAEIPILPNTRLIVINEGARMENACAAVG